MDLEGIAIEINLNSLGRADIEILLAFAEGRMRMNQAAKISRYDERTVAYHLNTVHVKTGIDPREFRGLAKLIDAINQYMPDEKGE